MDGASMDNTQAASGLSLSPSKGVDLEAAWVKCLLVKEGN